VERARWTDERHDDRMTAVDRTFDHVFEELRAERAEVRAEMRAERAELRTEMRALRAEIRDDMRAMSDRLDQRLGQVYARISRLDERIGRLDERLGDLEERLGRIGFRAAGILATGLIALVVTQL
jgi:uncharacterized protein involved in exopolysaccharide biosynthesis